MNCIPVFIQATQDSGPLSLAIGLWVGAMTTDIGLGHFWGRDDKCVVTG